MRLSEAKKRDYLIRLLYLHQNPNCEVCGERARDVHHIIYRSQGGKTEQDNMISLCRRDHDRAHFKNKLSLSRDDLWRAKGFGQNIEAMKEKCRKAKLGWKAKKV